MNGYAIMAIAGAVVWVVFTIIYAKKFNEGIRARKWYGLTAYLGLTALTGGLLEIFQEKLQSVSTMWVMIVIVVFIYLMGKIYIFNNIDYKQ